MIQLITGQKGKVLDLIGNPIFQITVNLKLEGEEIDVSCFGVDIQGRLSDDRYFVFYNQLSTPNGEIRKEAACDVFSVNLNELPNNVEKLVLTAAIDGSSDMSQLQESSVIFGDNHACYTLNGAQFQEEKAIILAEIYRLNGEWRIAIIGKGFNGGLSALLNYFGGEEVKEEVKEGEPAAPPPKPISLTKSEKVQSIVLDKAPHLVDLTKKAVISLEKRNLMDVKAQVVLVLDVSGSMYSQYKNGKVQRILDKTLPLALLFDDNSCLESWGFATRFRQLTDATLDNIKDYVNTTDGGWMSWNVGGSNNEPAVMEALYLKYKDSKQPVYILFISDGGVSKNRLIKQKITTASYAPIFWQFVGIHGSNYGALEQLDNMPDRFIDNANFFALDDIDSINDEALYDRLMNEFPTWLNKAKEKNLIVP